MTAVAFSSDSDLLDAIFQDRLSEWAQDILDDPAADARSRDMAERSRAACAQIRATNEAEARRLVHELAASDIAATSRVSHQRHSIGLDVDPDDASAAMGLLRAIGFDGGQEWTGAAARSFLRFAGATTFTRSGKHSTVVRLRWRRAVPNGSKLLGVLRRAVTPTPADWAMLDLPGPFWWAYGILRPVRLIAERIGILSDEHGDLEPFLVTPDVLLDPLFDVAELTPDDVFADIGCGDGRIVVAAAQRHGCRAIGIEQSARSVDAARRRVRDAGLSDRVEVVHAHASDADVSGVTAALLFVPMVVASRLVPALSDRFAPGARVVVHEQSRLPDSLPTPSRSVAIIAPEAVTVAHRWNRVTVS